MTSSLTRSVMRHGLWLEALRPAQRERFDPPRPAGVH